jgi:hypothetical protein
MNSDAGILTQNHISDQLHAMHLTRTIIQNIQGTYCDNAEPKFYFDVKTLACGQFDYTGCGPDDANRFDDEAECLAACGVAQTIPNIESLITEEFGKEFCLLF